MSYLKTFTKGIIKENPVLVMLLGTCPTLAVTTLAVNGLGMGLATTFVLVCSNIVISLLKNVIPKEVRLPSFIVIIAGFVTFVSFMLQSYLPNLYRALGVFLSLITVNCIILGRAEMFAIVQDDTSPFAVVHVQLAGQDFGGFAEERVAGLDAAQGFVVQLVGCGVPFAWLAFRARTGFRGVCGSLDLRAFTGEFLVVDGQGRGRDGDDAVGVDIACPSRGVLAEMQLAVAETHVKQAIAHRDMEQLASQAVFHDVARPPLPVGLPHQLAAFVQPVARFMPSDTGGGCQP